MNHLLVWLLAWLPVWAFAQDADLPLDDPLNHTIDRLVIQGEGLKWNSIRPFAREDITNLFYSSDSFDIHFKVSDWYTRLAELYTDSFADSNVKNRWLLANERDLISYFNSRIQVYLNPLLLAGIGGERYRNRFGEPDYQFLLNNLRGASLRIKLYGKVGLYSELLENQFLYSDYLRELTVQRFVPPGAGFNKSYRGRGFDFLNAKAYLTYSPAQFLRLKLGRDRVHYGSGFQSLLLSDWATDAYALQADWKLWKLHYHQRFAQLIDFIPGKADVVGDYPRKYGVWHQLSFSPIPQVEIAVFESVIYADQLPNSRRGFELQYLNPLIFYRTVEQAVGSPDNGFLGLQFRVDLLRQLRWYGQLVVDDYNFSQRKNGRSWWGNKYGWQLGAKYIDALGLQGVDIQLECNQVRPYLYSHFNTAAAYTHFGQPLAHPYGANLIELIGQIRWIITSRLVGSVDGTLLLQGVDTPGYNYGADIFRTNLVRDNGQPNPDFENKILQGDRRRVYRTNFLLSWQLGRLPAWLDGQLSWRKEQSASARKDWRPRNDVFGMIQLRWMMPYRRSLY